MGNERKNDEKHIEETKFAKGLQSKISSEWAGFGGVRRNSAPNAYTHNGHY